MQQAEALFDQLLVPGLLTAEIVLNGPT